MLSERLALLVSMDARGAVKGLESVGKAADRNLAKTEKGLDRTGKSLQKAGAGMASVGALALVGLGKAAKASEEAHLSLVKLDNTLANNPKLVGETSKAFVELADSIQAKTAADGDAIIAGQAMLGTFRVTGKQIRELTPLVVDYARKFSVDLVTANAQVGKALDGQVGALKRNGVSIDEALFKTDRYAAVQKALAEQVGGFAEAEGKTFAGSLERLKNQLGDLEESVGKGAVDAFTTLLGPVSKTAEALNGLDGGLTSTVGKVATFGAVGLTAAGGLSFLAGKAIQLRSSIAALPARLRELTTGLGRLSKLGIAAGIAGITYELVQLARATNQGTIDVEAFVAASAHLNAEQEKGLQAFIQVASAWGDLDDIVRKVTDSNVVAADRLLEQAEAAGITGKELADLKRIVQDKRAADAQGAVDQRRYAEETQGAADALEEESDAASSTAEKIKKLNDQLKAMFDPLFAAQDGLAKLAEAQDAVTEAERRYGRDSQEAIQARRDAVRAAVDYESALLSLKQGIEDGSVSVRDATSTLQDWVRQGRISEQQASEAAFAFGILQGKANDLSGTNVVVSVDADTRKALDKFEKLRQALAAAGGTSVGVHGGPAPRAHGGPVRRGGLYLVGEEGPELFTPGSSGTIIPNRQLAGSTAVGAAVAERPNVTYQIHVTALDPAQAAKAVKDALASSSRRGVA